MDHRARYVAACHAMQSGVAATMGLGDLTDTTPKHLRVGVNSALCDNSALARLLIAKGLFTLDEYYKAIADMMEEEVARYEAELSVNGAKITLV